MPIFNTVYWWWGWGWQPWEHTLWYFPLKNNIIDATWNLTLTTPWSITKDTIWYLVQWSAYALLSDYSARYVWVRCKVVTTPDTYVGIVTCGWPSMQYYFKHSGSAYSQKFVVFYTSSYAFSAIPATTNANQWYHFAVSYEGGKTYWYLNWEQYLIYNWMWANVFAKYCTAFWWWMDWGGETSPWTSTWIISDFIIEDEWWTKQQVLDYYNITKSNYWL